VKRVIFIEHHGDIIGGGQISLLLLMQNLGQHQPLCVCGGEGSMAEAVCERRLRLELMPMPSLGPRSFGTVWSGVKRLRRLIGEQQGVLLHANSSRGMFYAGLAGWLSGIPVIWHVRVGGTDGWWDRLLASWATRIVVISKSVQTRFPWRGAAKKVRLIHNGVDVLGGASGDGREWRQRLGYGERPLVGMVAQLIPWKRQDDFIRGMARVAQKFPEAGFLLVGADPGPDAAYERQLRELVAELGLEERVAFVGFCEDVPGIMAMLDILVLTSENEPFGRVLIEGMAASRPVVATEGGGVGEIVVEGETGLLVPVGDVEGIAAAVERLLADPEAGRAMGEKGRQRAAALFSIEAHVQQVEELYQEVLAGGRTHCPQLPGAPHEAIR
jgi:L-malate glycosyltransferase